MDNKGLLIAGGLIALAFLWPKKGTAATGAPALAGGAIGSVSLGQAKAPGDLANVNVTWAPGTTDFKGALISWPYKFQVVRRVNGSGQDTIFSSAQTVAPGPTRTDYVAATVPQAVAPFTFDVQVFLLAAPSNPDGTPNTAAPSWTALGNAISNSLSIAAATGPAVVGATISSVVLSQRMGSMGRFGLRRGGLRLHNYDPAIGGVLDPNAYGITLEPNLDPPQVPHGAIASGNWQLQNAAMTRPGRVAYGNQPFQGSYQENYPAEQTRIGLDRPTFIGGAQNANGPSERYYHGQTTLIPFYTPNVPRGAARGY